MKRATIGAMALTMHQRSRDPELLDNPALPGNSVARAYRDIHATHRWLGNHAAVVRLLRADPQGVRSVLDIGCGQGALLADLRRRLNVEVTGFDLRPAPPSSAVRIMTGDAVRAPLPRADVAIALCLAHHLSDAEFIRLIRNVSRSCRRFIVLDLVRHRIPMALFRAFVRPLLSEIPREDGATSIRRSRTPREMRNLADTAVRGSGGRVRHSVSPFYIRQVLDISW